MALYRVFVPGGVYLRTPTGELIGRPDKPGAPFETLDEARDKADWLEMMVQLQQMNRQRDLAGVGYLIPAPDGNHLP